MYSLAVDAADLERCVATCLQAQELLGAPETDPPLWRQVNDELARTLLLYATWLDERGLEPPPPPAATASSDAASSAGGTATVRTAPTLMDEAARRFLAAGNATAAADVFYRLGALECRRYLRAPTAAGASEHGATAACVAPSCARVAPSLVTAQAPSCARVAPSLVTAQANFERSLELLSPDTHPADHLFVRLDLVKLLRHVRPVPPTVPEKIRGLREALAHLLATHAVFAAFRFPLLPVTATRTLLPAAQAAPTAQAAAAAAAHAAVVPSPAQALCTGSRECALVAALWPVMEAELHAILKELVRLHGQAAQPTHASLFKQLYRLSLTQRDMLGTGLLGRLSAELEARRRQELGEA